MNPRVSLGLRIGAVLAVLTAALFNSLRLGLLPIVLIAIYSVIVLKNHRQDPAKLELLADQAYFLGYLSTISAFAAILVKVIWEESLPDSPKPILLMLCVALLATVAGIIAMTSLKDVAANQRTSLLYA